MPRRLTRIAIAGVGEIVAPPPLLAVVDDNVSAQVSTGLLAIDVLANDTPAGGIKITALSTTAPLPAANLSIIGAEPAQKAQVNLAGLAAGNYSFAYAAALISDPSVTASGGVALTLTAVTVLPVADVRAISSDARPEGDSGSKTWIFAASRTGDLTGGASCTWALEGSLVADDLVTGQDTTGTYAWAAGDGSDQQISISVKGDTTVETDETIRIRISAPVGCTIGTATAELTITNDDVATSPGLDKYDEKLAFGGMMLGTANQDGGLGNQVVHSARSVALVVYLESLLPIWCIQTENRYDKYPLSSRTGNTGYSDHTVIRDGTTYRDPENGTDAESGFPIAQQVQGGDMRWLVAKVTSTEDATVLAYDAAAGSTTRILRYATNENWGPEHKDAGGDGTVPSQIAGSGSSPFMMYPTIFFRDGDGKLKAIDPKDPAGDGTVAAWKIGDRIAFIADGNAPQNYKGNSGTFSQSVAPDRATPDRWVGQSRWNSVNQGFRETRGNGGSNPVRSSYRLMRKAGLWVNKNLDDRYLPVLLIGHKRTDGTTLAKGNAFGGYAETELNYINFGGSTGDGVRQLIRIPSGWTGRKLLAADCSVFRVGAGSSNLTVSVYRAKTVPVANTSSDDGTLLGSATFTDIIDGGGNPSRASGEAHRRVNLTATTNEDLKVKDGEVYFVEVALAGGTANYKICRLLNYMDRGGSMGPLQKADHQDSLNFFQVRSGTGNWTRPDPFNAQKYTMAGMALHFDATL
jgi:hypothetical protein